MTDSVLVVGKGGREHCLAWKLAQSEHVRQVFIAPGNGGTNIVTKSKIQNLDTLDISNHCAMKDACVLHKIDLVVIGPEMPLEEGLVDYLTAKGIQCFGPTKAASRIETSKAFSKEFMTRYNIPTARFKTFEDPVKACEFIREAEFPALVVKASGLAAGKGVIVGESITEAEQAVKDMLENNAFGEAGKTIVIEEKLEGKEISVLAFSDGKLVSPMPAAQDHKRAYDGDLGPNTGGMGAYAPYPDLSDDELQFIVENILQKTIDGLAKEGCPFVGVLFAGVMLTTNGPKCLEFNCRFGDPETQVILPLLKSDLYATLMESVSGDLTSALPSWKRGCTAVGVVMASGGYPGDYNTGYPITGTENFKGSDDVFVFHAGTKFDSETNQLLTSGGRVLSVVAVSDTVNNARDKAYESVQQISFENAEYRKDIAKKVIKKSKFTYKNAGVNIDKGNELVQLIKPLANSTFRDGCLSGLGGFGGLFDLKAAGYQDPVLVSGADGVGTKLKIAQRSGNHSTIGIDLVAMCVNDILAHGAEPLFFLDYFATSCLDVSVAKEVIEGIATGCKMAGCVLLGGETAEMPDMYNNGEYDVAGFAVGAVERSAMLPSKDTIVSDDVVVGLSSSGLHSNGFSLVRKVVEMCPGLTYDSPCPFDQSGQSLGDTLMTPTKIYVKSALPVLRSGLVKAFVHVTGGGLIENIPRVLPENLGVTLNAGNWEIPPVFGWLCKIANISASEMQRTFNCGLGAILICSGDTVEQVLKLLQENGESSARIVGGVRELCDDNGCRVVIEDFDENLMKTCHDVMLSSGVINGCKVNRKRTPVGVLISGSGTNLQALIDQASKPESSAEIVLVISNVPDVQGLERAKIAGIPTKVLIHKDFKTRNEFDMAIHEALVKANVEMVCLAGFMRILTGDFVRLWHGRMLNTHPSLLPSFKGMHAHRDVLNAGVKISGCTVHFVVEEVDAGAIVAQESVAVLPDDTVDTLQERVKKAEHICYPKAMELLASGRIKLTNSSIEYQW